MQKKKFGNFYIFTKKQTDFQVIFQLFTARVRSLPPGQPAVFNNLRKTTQNDTNLHKSTQNYSNYFKKILSNQSIIFTYKHHYIYQSTTIYTKVVSK